ncbi:MAG: LamG domain-containing protein [Lentisphaerae bacterium]|nr:LamG domain-containing protein [Lentisphaerota bacterium]
MSIASEIERIRNAKNALKSVINARGGSLAGETLEYYADAVSALPSGDGSVDLSFVTAQAGDIRSGKVGASSTGTPVIGTLDPSSGSSGMDFYKCSSVDTSAKTWAGYKAVLADGVYSFEETVTEGLSYTIITPAVGNVYTADTLAEIKNLYDGSDPTMVFYAPFSENKATAETGQTLNVSGNPVYGEIGGIPCVTFDGSSGYSTPGIDVSQFVDGFTVSCFAQPADRGSHTIVFGRRNGTYSCQYAFKLGIQEITCWAANSDVTANVYKSDIPEINKMTHAAWRYKDGKFDLFIGGELVASGNGTIGSQDSGDTQIAATLYSSENYVGSLAALRLYNRALTDDEIMKLAGEFDV